MPFAAMYGHPYIALNHLHEHLQAVCAKRVNLFMAL